MTDFKFPLISVLVPVYNAEPFLVMCLDSIFAQTYPNFEVVCIDDASADKSADILEQYARKHPRMKLLKLPAHQSVAVVRNLLLQEAAGEYIAFIDADDSVHPEYLAHLYQAAQNTGADVVRCLYQLQDIRKNTLVPCEKKYKGFSHLLPPSTSLERLQAALDDSQVWLKLIKTSLLKEHKIGFIPHVLPEDISFEILLYQYSKKIVFLPEHLYVYRVGNANSVSSNRSLCAYGTLEAMVFLCGDLVQRHLVEKAFYEKIIGLTLHAVRRIRKYSFAPEYAVSKICREAFNQIEKSARYCGPVKKYKYQFMCQIARHLKDSHLSYLACIVR